MVRKPIDARDQMIPIDVLYAKMSHRHGLKPFETAATFAQTS